MNVTLTIPALDEISTNLARLVEVEKQRLAFEQKNMIAASDVLALINDYNAVVLADANDKAALATAQANLATAQSEIAEFNDPTLATALSAALANAAAATPPATPVTPVTPPVTPPADPNATNPDGSLVSGNVTNPDGSVTTTAGTVIPAPAPAVAPAS